MVAARGYSLADAFLVAAIAVPVWHRMKDRPSRRTCCILASLALGLSFCANFSFGFVDLAAFLAIVTWAVRRREGESVARVIEYCTLPGLFVVLLVCGYPLAHWNREDLSWGAQSFSEMTRSLTESSVYRLDPRFRDAGLYAVMNFLRPVLLPLLGILCASQVVVTRLEGSWLRDAQARWLGSFAALLAAIAVASVTMSWLAFRFVKLPLPLGRTGIYLVPLLTLVAGIIAAAPIRSSVSQGLRRGIGAVFICLACYFLLCLRLTYFHEYEWGTDAKEVYSVLARLNHVYGVTEVGATGLYHSSLNYYRVLSKGETFSEFTLMDSDAPFDKSICVINGVHERRILDREKLVVIYRGKSSDVVVAVRPDGPVAAAMIEP
jgi:hypothetical protein